MKAPGRLVTDPTRSALMRRVRRSRTAPEEEVAALLRTLGARYRRNVSSLPGSPDFANRRRGWAIFVNGCFWHHHRNCSRATSPKRNAEFWSAKFQSNRNRDAVKIKRLLRMGLRVLLVWECEVVDRGNLAIRLDGFLRRRQIAAKRLA